VLDSLLQHWDRPWAADRQAGHGHAATGKGRFEVAPRRVALDRDRVGVVGVTDVADAQSVRYLGRRATCEGAFVVVDW